MSESIKERLHKLIKLQKGAEEIGSLHEAENAAARIRALLIKYNLELEDAKSPEDKGNLIVKGLKWDLKPLMQRHEGKWIINLISAISFSNMCKIIILDKDHTVVDLIGTDINSDITQYMTSYLVHNLRIIGKKEFRQYTGDTKRNTWLRGFYLGAVQSLTTRLMEERKKSTRDSKTNQLMIVRDQDVKEYINNKYEGRLGKANTSSRTSGMDGVKRGREVGKSIGLNKGVGGSNRNTKLIG